MRRLKRKIITCGLLLIISYLTIKINPLDLHTTEVRYKEASVVKVVDGDTIVIRYKNLKTDKVRLIGVDTPESVAPIESGKINTEEGRQASEFTKGILKKGTTVYLESDEGDRDTYGRALRYVWLEKPAADTPTAEEIRDEMLNGILLRDKKAVTMTIEPNTKYEGVFKEIEDGRL